MERLLALLGDPHRCFRSVHIAGTKGKGSTAAMLESVLRAAGFRTGLYTSPHLHTFRERIRCGDRMISRRTVAALTGRLRPAVAQVPGLTTFEIITGLAFAHFAAMGVEMAVVEVGMGGRLDATNVVHPLVTIITSISYDHTYVLGDTLAAIAGEKAGIVKRGVPVVSAPQPPEALAVVEAVCREKRAPLTLVGRDWTWQPGAADLDGQSFSVQPAEGEPINPLWIPLLGEHQLLNATVALAATAQLRRAGLDIPPAAVRGGLRRVHWPGRMEVLGRAPLVIADGAHNAEAARRLAEAIERHLPHRDVILLFGASADKDVAGMWRELLPLAAHVIVVRAAHSRAADAHDLARQVVAQGRQPIIAGSVAQGLDRALGLAGADDVVLATGSLFVAAEARAAWAATNGQSVPEGDD